MTIDDDLQRVLTSIDQEKARHRNVRQRAAIARRTGKPVTPAVEELDPYAFYDRPLRPGDQVRALVDKTFAPGISTTMHQTGWIWGDGNVHGVRAWMVGFPRDGRSACIPLHRDEFELFEWTDVRCKSFAEHFAYNFGLTMTGARTLARQLGFDLEDY